MDNQKKIYGSKPINSDQESNNNSIRVIGESMDSSSNSVKKSMQGGLRDALSQSFTKKVVVDKNTSIPATIEEKDKINRSKGEVKSESRIEGGGREVQLSDAERRIRQWALQPLIFIHKKKILKGPTQGFCKLLDQQFLKDCTVWNLGTGQVNLCKSAVASFQHNLHVQMQGISKDPAYLITQAAEIQQYCNLTKQEAVAPLKRIFGTLEEHIIQADYACMAAHCFVISWVDGLKRIVPNSELEVLLQYLENWVILEKAERLYSKFRSEESRNNSMNNSILNVSHIPIRTEEINSSINDLANLVEREEPKLESVLNEMESEEQQVLFKVIPGSKKIEPLTKKVGRPKKEASRTSDSLGQQSSREEGEIRVERGSTQQQIQENTEAVLRQEVNRLNQAMQATVLQESENFRTAQNNFVELEKKLKALEVESKEQVPFRPNAEGKNTKPGSILKNKVIKAPQMMMIDQSFLIQDGKVNSYGVGIVVRAKLERFLKSNLGNVKKFSLAGRTFCPPPPPTPPGANPPKKWNKKKNNSSRSNSKSSSRSNSGNQQRSKGNQNQGNQKKFKKKSRSNSRDSSSDSFRNNSRSNSEKKVSFSLQKNKPRWNKKKKNNNQQQKKQQNNQSRSQSKNTSDNNSRRSSKNSKGSQQKKKQSSQKKKQKSKSKQGRSKSQQKKKGNQQKKQNSSKKKNPQKMEDYMKLCNVVNKDHDRAACGLYHKGQQRCKFANKCTTIGRCQYTHPFQVESNQKVDQCDKKPCLKSRFGICNKMHKEKRKNPQPKIYTNSIGFKQSKFNLTVPKVGYGVVYSPLMFLKQHVVQAMAAFENTVVSVAKNVVNVITVGDKNLSQIVRKLYEIKIVMVGDQKVETKFKIDANMKHVMEIDNTTIHPYLEQYKKVWKTVSRIKTFFDSNKWDDASRDNIHAVAKLMLTANKSVENVDLYDWSTLKLELVHEISMDVPAACCKVSEKISVFVKDLVLGKFGVFHPITGDQHVLVKNRIIAVLKDNRTSETLKKMQRSMAEYPANVMKLEQEVKNMLLLAKQLEVKTIPQVTQIINLGGGNDNRMVDDTMEEIKVQLDPAKAKYQNYSDPLGRQFQTPSLNAQCFRVDLQAQMVQNLTILEGQIDTATGDTFYPFDIFENSSRMTGQVPHCITFQNVEAYVQNHLKDCLKEAKLQQPLNEEWMKEADQRNGKSIYGSFKQMIQGLKRALGRNIRATPASVLSSVITYAKLFKADDIWQLVNIAMLLHRQVSLTREEQIAMVAAVTSIFGRAVNGDPVYDEVSLLDCIQEIFEPR